MLLDMRTLQGSGGSSRGVCRSTSLSDSSVLLGWLGDSDLGEACASEIVGAAGGAAGDVSADTLGKPKKKEKGVMT